MIEKFFEFNKPTIRDKATINSNDLAELPDEIIYLITKYNNASFLNDYIFIVNPFDYVTLLNSIYIPFSEPSTCFARDAFGSLYVWENNSIKLVNVRYGLSEIIGRKPSVFFNFKMTDNGFLKKRLKIDTFKIAHEKLGSVSLDECYGYFPILASGGAEKPENLKLVKMREHIELISQLAGKIE